MTEGYKYHAFLTHDWGKDQAGRDNHQRVVQIARRLNTYGLKVWIDEEEMTGHIVMQMCTGIDDSKLVVVFVTKRYMEKLKLPNDNCASEFQYAQQTKGVEEMLAVVMEKEMADTRQWRGPLGMKLGGNLYVSMWDDDVTTGVENLVREMAKRLPGWTPSSSGERPTPTPTKTETQTETQTKTETQTTTDQNNDAKRLENERLQKEKADKEKADKEKTQKDSAKEEELEKKEREEHQKRMLKLQQQRDQVRQDKERLIREGFEKEKKKLISTHKSITSKLEGTTKILSYGTNQQSINEKDAELLAFILIKNTALRRFSIAGTKLRNEGAVFGVALGLTQNLVVLQLTWCKLGAEAFEWIGDGLMRNTSLTDLDLEGNKVGEEGPLGHETLMEGLLKNSTLQRLKLNNTELKEESCRWVSDVIANNSPLDYH